MPFCVRSATPKDKPLIVEAIGEYLPDLEPHARWEWLYESNPHGKALTWVVMDEASGRLAGLTSFFRRRLLVDGREVSGALGGDGYVRPAFRRRGLGALMHQASRRDMASFGVEVMFGTPMPANLTPLTKAGARTISETVRYVRPLDARMLRVSGPVGRAVTRFIRPRPGDARLEPMAPNDPRVDEVWQGARAELRIATVRDAAFYTWRFLGSPTGQHKPFVVMEGNRPVAACALQLHGNAVWIVDLVAPERAWGPALAAAATFAPGASAVAIKLVREDARGRWLWRHGFVGRDSKPFNLLLPQGEPLADVYYDPKRWFATWADSDI